MADHLGEFEFLVLLALHAGRGEAYGYTIQMALAIGAQREVSLGTICKTLHRLEAKGLAGSRLGTARPEPGGRRQKHYAITPDGARALERTLAGIASFIGR